MMLKYFIYKINLIMEWKIEQNLSIFCYVLFLLYFRIKNRVKLNMPYYRVFLTGICSQSWIIKAQICCRFHKLLPSRQLIGHGSWCLLTIQALQPYQSICGHCSFLYFADINFLLFGDITFIVFSYFEEFNLSSTYIRK